MIKIIISYLFILVTTIGIGIPLNKWINLTEKNILFTVLVGFFNIIVFSTFYAVFNPLDLSFFLLILFISTLSILINKTLCREIIDKTKNSFLKFSKSSKTFFILIVCTSLIHSSSLPFITDNESYYIQTIKWLNNYGLVKGLANFHVFLSQTSGWHILQSIFSFSFIDSYFNDLNGFLIVLIGFYCIDKWELYKDYKNKNDLFVSLLLMSFFFLYFFVPSPSPDLPIIVITCIVIHLYLDLRQSKLNNQTNLICILILLLILIKVTIAPIVLLLFISIIKSNNIKTMQFFVITSLLAAISFITKNIIISGFPFYPLTMGNNFIEVDWKLNNSLQHLYYKLTSMYGWQVNNWKEFNNLKFIEKFWIWLNLPKLNGIFNKLILLTMILFPIIYRKKKNTYLLYVYFVTQFVIFYSTSPQYRFFLPVFLCMLLLIGIDLFDQKIKLIKSIIYLNLCFLLIVGIFGVKLESITNNNIMKEKVAFKMSQIITPKPNTQFDKLEYSKHDLKNLKYYSPVSESLFFWQTSDGPLPCANQKMIEYFSQNFNHIPQLRSNKIEDGFFSDRP